MPGVNGDRPGAPSVSVTIAAYTMDRWHDLVRAVESVGSQTQPPEEILVVIDHNDELLERSREHWGAGAGAGGAGPVVLVAPNGEERGLSGARNTAVRRAGGDVVAFLDDDAEADPRWLEHLTAPYADPDVFATGGYADPEFRAPRPRWMPREFDWVIGCSYTGLPTERSTVRNVIGCNMSVRRVLMEDIGGFAHGIGRIGTRALGCEETDLCIRIRQRWPTLRAVYEPRAVVRHAVPASRLTTRYYFDRCYAEGLSKALVVESVGGADGLAAERAYSTRVLPRAVVRGVTEATQGDRTGLLRSAAVCAGLGVTTYGYVAGRAIALRRARAGARAA